MIPLIDNVSYELLENLYDIGNLTESEVNKITNNSEPRNPHIALLQEERLVQPFMEGMKKDGEGGFTGGVSCVRITLRGRAYVEQRRREMVG